MFGEKKEATTSSQMTRRRKRTVPRIKAEEGEGVILPPQEPELEPASLPEAVINLPKHLETIFHRARGKANQKEDKQIKATMNSAELRLLFTAFEQYMLEECVTSQLRHVAVTSGTNKSRSGIPLFTIRK